jgi:cold shock CspA family protein
LDKISENDKVSFELERGMKGMNAVKVKLIWF